ncbi:MAG: helix-turn-helix transcriptional regulator [Acidimicrobiales bacterium]
MNRTDRLYALVEELRAAAPGYRSASWLARRFEVSVRTIERDLSALQQAGVPIYASSGRTGGYAIDATRTLPPLNFSAAEATAIAVALARPGATPLAQSARTALQKLLAAMAVAEADGARALAGRVHVMTAPSAGMPVSADLERALVDGQVVEADYEDRTGAVSRRRIEPLGFVGVKDSWYLVGWCRLREDRRVFRVDRFQTVRVLDERAPDRGEFGGPPDLEGLVARPTQLE